MCPYGAACHMSSLRNYKLQTSTPVHLCQNVTNLENTAMLLGPVALHPKKLKFSLKCSFCDGKEAEQAFRSGSFPVVQWLPRALFVITCGWFFFFWRGNSLKWRNLEHFLKLTRHVRWKNKVVSPLLKNVFTGFCILSFLWNF